MANFNLPALDGAPVTWRYFTMLLMGNVTSVDDGMMMRGEYVRAGPFATAAEAESTGEDAMRHDASIVGYAVQGRREAP